jgi:MutS domain V/MutS domain I
MRFSILSLLVWLLFDESSSAFPTMHRLLRRHSLGGHLYARQSSDAASSIKLQSFQQKLTELNGGQEINVKSPKQVSQAIFGTFQSTSRQALLRASLDEKRRTMATLVLEIRELSCKIDQQDEGSTEEITPYSGLAEEDDVEQLNIISPPRQLSSTKSSYDLHVEALFDSKCSKIDIVWKEPMLKLTKPSARNMVFQFAPDCPMGYNPLASPLGVTSSTATLTAGKQGSLLHYCREQKERYSHCVILTRVGDFYEAFGVDAALLVEHCGLNPMGGKGRAGCPVRNVQATLDDLTQFGYSVAVLEEVSETDSQRGPSKAKSGLKARMLGQIVSPANPTYLHDLLLEDNGILFNAPASRPHVAILSQMRGATYLEVNVEERSIHVSSGLTPEAVACRIMAYPPAEPVVYVGSSKPNFKARTVSLPPSLLPEKEPEKGLLRQLLQHIEGEELPLEAFRWVPSQQNGANPLYVETASQLGLMKDPSIPSLIDCILPESAPAATKRFLRKWLLVPPPIPVSESMATVVHHLKEEGGALPPLSVPPVGKIVALLRAGQASAEVYGDLLAAIDATLQSLDILKQLKGPFMLLLQHESGIASSVESLKERCKEASNLMEEIISPIHHVHGKGEDPISDYGDLVPRGFFERNEASWRGRVQSASHAYERVDEKAMALTMAVAADLWGAKEANIKDMIEAATGKKSPIVQDIFNNLFAVKQKPTVDNEKEYFNPKDRFGKLIGNRYTTKRVQSALSEYVEACEEACQAVTVALANLSHRLCDEGHLPAIIQAAHFNLILSTASHHAAKANTLGWSMAKIYDRASEPTLTDTAGCFIGVWPYWMDKTEAISNSFNADGMFLLTAPNMSGKSTLMRSTAAAALLANCGLCAPLSAGSAIRRFDNIFVRGASADVPIENKSAFGAEMGDIAALLRSCGRDSLVFVDELGRGTSPRDGTCIAAAVLETMSVAGISGIFATHLHDIMDLPLLGWDRIRKKRMAIEGNDTGDDNYSWTYKLEDGVCTESLALVTAARFGLPHGVLSRAASFTEILDSHDDLTSQDGLTSQPAGKMHVEKAKGLDDACQLIFCSDTVMRIPPGWRSPSCLEGTSCVYILELIESPNCVRFYVGETDSMGKRLEQHRAKGGAWSEATAAAFAVPGGKTQARNMESLAIQRLAQAGFNLISISDGRAIRPAGRL